jgi:hypothetical protein
VTVWSTGSTGGGPEGDEAGDPTRVSAVDDVLEAYEGTDSHEAEDLPALALDLAPTPLESGILRVSRGRLRVPDVATYAELVSRDLAPYGLGHDGPADLVVAGQGSSFTMISTWPDWAAIESATGATIAEPLITKRLAGLDSFEVVHYELLTELPGPSD